MDHLFTADIVHYQESLSHTFHTYSPIFFNSDNPDPILDIYPIMENYHINQFEKKVQIEGDFLLILLYKSPDFLVRYHEIRSNFTTISQIPHCDKKLQHKIFIQIPKKELHYRILKDEILLHGTIEINCTYYYTSDVYLLPKPEKSQEIIDTDILLKDNFMQIENVFFHKNKAF